MSWQAYVDQNLVGTGNIKKGAIFGIDGSTWAHSPGFDVTPAEVAALVSCFTDNGKVFSQGVFLQGAKYMGLKADARSVYGKKGATGIVCVKTGKAILVGFYDDSIQPGPATITVEKLADYLIENGY